MPILKLKKKQEFLKKLFLYFLLSSFSMLFGCATQTGEFFGEMGDSISKGTEEGDVGSVAIDTTALLLGTPFTVMMDVVTLGGALDEDDLGKIADASTKVADNYQNSQNTSHNTDYGTGYVPAIPFGENPSDYDNSNVYRGASSPQSNNNNVSTNTTPLVLAYNNQSSQNSTTTVPVEATPTANIAWCNDKKKLITDTSANLPEGSITESQETLMFILKTNMDLIKEGCTSDGVTLDQLNASYHQAEEACNAVQSSGRLCEARRHAYSPPAETPKFPTMTVPVI